MNKKQRLVIVTNKKNPARRKGLFSQITSLIEGSRSRVALKVNSELCFLYWEIGYLVKKDILKNKRANYGEEIISNLAIKLSDNYGNGWSKQQLWNCLRSAETFAKKEIVYALRRQLSWTYIRTLAYIENKTKRTFYTEMCIAEQWNTRLLNDKIDGMLYERTAISKKPEKLIKKEITELRLKKVTTPDLVFKDPYFLDYLGLKEMYSESDMEGAIINELQRFIIELGSDFAFIARQKRILIGGDDHYIDLLFYHRNMKRLVVIDLKLGKFKAAYKGQMELYLRWLNKHEKREGEASPIGLILCAEKDDEYIELLELDKSNIRVAEYLTSLPSKKLLQQKFHKAIAVAKRKFEHQN